MLTATSFSGAKLQARQARQTRVQARTVVAVQANASKALAAAALAATFALGTVPAAHADLTADLLAKSEANKELHNKQRLAASNLNFARSRTVTDGTCSFPANFLGCDIGKYAGDVKYYAEKAAVECAGTEPGLCTGNMNATKYASR